MFPKNLLFVLALWVSSVQAFLPSTTTTVRTSQHGALSSTVLPQAWKDQAAVASAALLTANLPVWAAMAVEDDYEYGAVDAPPLIPIVGGILAIATALLPIVLRPGEDAFEEVSCHDYYYCWRFFCAFWQRKDGL